MATDAYLDAYRSTLRRHGCGFNATLWSSPDSQRRRFEVFARMHPLAGKRILDAGCSRGDFAAFLLERGIPFDRYLGIDALPEVIEHASARSLPGCAFVAADMLLDATALARGEAEVVCLSGTLNTMGDREVRRTLELAWEAAGEALLFNFLSDRAGPDATPQYAPVRRFDTLSLLAWAMEQTSAVAFRQDYMDHGHDATIVMLKSGVA